MRKVIWRFATGRMSKRSLPLLVGLSLLLLAVDLGRRGGAETGCGRGVKRSLGLNIKPSRLLEKVSVRRTLQ